MGKDKNSKCYKSNNVNELKDVQEKIFNKYATRYGTTSEQSKKNQAEVDRHRQKYIYQQLNKKGLDNTNVEKLLDLLADDIHHQYSMKQDMENKIGFLFAFLGVIMTIILQQNYIIDCIPIMCDGVTVIEFIKLMLLVLMFITFIISVVQLIIGFNTSDLSKFLYDDKDKHFKCAVEDKNMSIVLLLDINTNVWKHNEEILTNKSKYIKILYIIISYNNKCLLLEEE